MFLFGIRLKNVTVTSLGVLRGTVTRGAEEIFLVALFQGLGYLCSVSDIHKIRLGWRDVFLEKSQIVACLLKETANTTSCYPSCPVRQRYGQTPFFMSSRSSRCVTSLILLRSCYTQPPCPLKGSITIHKISMLIFARILTLGKIIVTLPHYKKMIRGQ